MRHLPGKWAVAAALLLIGPAVARAQTAEGPGTDAGPAAGYPSGYQQPNVELVNDYDQAGQPVAGETVASQYAADIPMEGAPGQPCCPNCNGKGCAQCDPRRLKRPCADPCPRIGWYGFMGVDSWRGVTTGTYQSNNGFAGGLNGGVPLPWLGTYGFGAQFGGSYAAYDFNGQSSPPPGSSEVMQQIFLTTGFFRRPDQRVPIGFGIVQDWMIANSYGTYSNSPTVGQVRMQIGYAFNPLNEIGLWGAVHDFDSNKNVAAPGVPAMMQTYRAINQLNLFWHHKWLLFGGDSWMYVGVPQQSRLPETTFPAGTGGSLGEFILGANWMAPLNDCVSLYANTVYMKPSAHAGTQPNGAEAAAQEFWNISFGLAIYPQRAARSTTVGGRQWMPYMPLANNGNFFVDTTRTQ